MVLFSVVLSLCASLLCVDATPQGAPQNACASLTPAHGSIPAQSTPPPFTVSVQATDNKVKVKISSPAGDEFEGFALQARSSKDKSKLVEGIFSVKEGVSHTIDCFRGEQNTLTHVNPNPKSEVVTEWVPSESVNEDVIFRATVAKTFAVFWIEIDSRAVRISSTSRGPPTPSADRHAGHSAGSSMYHNCFESEGCFGLPDGCVEGHDCEVLLTYKNTGDGISFKLFGYLESMHYMAMGLSYDNKMGDDFVTDCTRQQSSVKSRRFWNQGKLPQFIEELTQNQYDGSFKDGLTSCSWTANYLTVAPNGREFDLQNETYNILLAKGSTNGNGELEYHSARIASQEKVNFTAFEAIAGQGVDDAIKIHGTFMITGWLGFVGLGILLARHFKNEFESRTICGVKVWFALHRGFMIAALSFVAVAFVVIFVYKNGWNYATSNPHAILGCTATALGFFQPIMAAFRPAPDHPKRPIFNWLHFLVGNSAYIVAVITIFFAVSLESSGLKQSFYWIISIFVIVHVIFHLLFQVNAWSSEKQKNNEIRMLDMSAARSNNMHNNLPEKSQGGNVFRVLLLGIYSMFLVVMLMTMYSLIGVA